MCGSKNLAGIPCGECAAIKQPAARGSANQKVKKEFLGGQMDALKVHPSRKEEDFLLSHG